MLECEIGTVLSTIINPIVRDNWEMVMKAIEEQGQYCGYEYIAEYDDYRSELAFQLQERFEDIIPFQWGGCEEEEN